MANHLNEIEKRLWAAADQSGPIQSLRPTSTPRLPRIALLALRREAIADTQGPLRAANGSSRRSVTPQSYQRLGGLSAGTQLGFRTY